MTAGLVEFLRARLDEDEATAGAALGPPRYSGGGTAADEVIWMAANEGCVPDAVAHFERHDPARVLADIAAKRAVLDMFLDTGHLDPETRVWYEVLAHLSIAHADHPDYRQEWRSALDDDSEGGS